VTATHRQPGAAPAMTGERLVMRPARGRARVLGCADCAVRPDCGPRGREQPSQDEREFLPNRGVRRWLLDHDDVLEGRVGWAPGVQRGDRRRGPDGRRRALPAAGARDAPVHRPLAHMMKNDRRGAVSRAPGIA
jgi:hypothetical protein